MAETINRACNGSRKWHWDEVMNDLKEKGGLAGVVVDPTSVTNHSCGGQTKKGTKFYITWVPGTFLLLTMSQEEKDLIEAFAKILEYRPFCRYINEHELLTIEWDKKDPERRFIKLEKENKMELQKI